MLCQQMIKRLVSFIRFALNGSPHIKTSGLNERFSFFNKCTNLYFCVLEHIADRSTESFHATEMLLIPQTSNFAVSLTLKPRAVTECDLPPPPRQRFDRNSQFTPKKSKFKIALCKTSICDQCVCKDLIHLKKNWRSWRHKISIIL